VVLKGIEPDVTAKKVIDVLKKKKGFSAKNVGNIINRKRAAGARQQSFEEK